MVETKKFIVGTSELASILGLTDSRIRQMERSGILTKIERGKYDLASSVQGYCAYLKEVAEQPEGMSEKDLLDRSRRKKIDLEIQIMQGELHRAGDVQRVMNNMIGTVRSRCLSIPYKLAPQLIATTEIPVIQATIKKEIYEALTELSNYDPRVFYAQSKDKLVLDDGGEVEHEKKESRDDEET